MAEQIADDQAMEMLRQQMGIQPGAASRITVQFSILAEQDMDESAKQQKPVFREVEYITKWVPGDKDNVVHRPVRLMDKAEFPDAYKAFKMNQEQPQTGTPLEMIPSMSKAQIAELGYYGIKTAEQLTTMADVNGQKVMGFQAIKAQAQKYLDAVAGAQPALKMQAELDKRDEKIAMLEQMVKELGERQDKQKKGA
jgi:hypothetical protein